MGTRLTRSGFASRSRRNLGGEPLPPEDRKDVAEYLYKERQWPMEDLAKSLGVSNSTISTDLADSDISHMGNADDRKDSLGRKASLGRPRALLRWSNGGRPEAADLPG